MKSLKKAKYLARKAKTAYKKEGFLPMLRRIRQYCKIRGSVRGIVGKGKSYDFVNIKKTSKEIKLPTEGSPITLNWLIPDFAVGAGGHMTIFRIIAELEKKGVKNNIHICGPLIHRKTVSQFKAAIADHFIDLQADIFIGTEIMPDAHGLVATAWDTAYEVARLKNSKVKGFYFVQDFEPYFYPHGSEYHFAENSYKLGLQGITAGPWLANILQEKYNMNSSHFDLAADPSFYKKANRREEQEPFKICFYSRPVTPRRCFDLGIQAFRHLKEGDSSSYEIHFFGGDTSFYNVPFEYHNHGVLSHSELSHLYSKMDLGVVFSPTNHSLVPREMMTTGLPVLEIESDSNKFIYDSGQNIILAKPDPSVVASEIEKLKEDREKRTKIAESGFQSAQKYSWSKSGEMVYSIVKDHISITHN